MASQAALALKKDFIEQVKVFMDQQGVGQSELAVRLGISPSNVSQLFNQPRNLTIRSMVVLVRALGLKLAVLPYPDELPQIKGEVFRATWEAQGRPRDFFDLKEGDTFAGKQR